MIRVVCSALAVALGVQAQTQVPTAGPEAAKAVVNRYCVGCHNEKLQSGGVALDALNPHAVSAGAETWEKVLRKVRTGEMPPPKLPRPDAGASASLVTWLEDALDQTAKAERHPGTPIIHRLNRAEYSNAVRDLLALDMDHSASLPADDSGYGFDNIGDVLSVSPLHMEKYMAAGRRVSRLAVGTAKLSPAVEKYTPGKAGTLDASSDMPLNMRQAVVVRRFFPADAEYSLMARVRGNPDPSIPQGRIDIRVDGVRVKVFDANVNMAEEAQQQRNFEVRVPLTAGMHTVGAGFLTEYTKSETGVVIRARFGQAAPPIPLSVEYLQIGGPFNPTGPGNTESRKRIFVCRPATVADELPCAYTILSSLARQAYRRPVGAADLDPLVKLFAAGRQDGGSFERGIETALRAILVSPNFLFRVEHSPKGSDPGSIRPVSELELASRLSFFLWSSIPDEELLQLAEHQKLRPAIPQQVRRMLADPKAQALTDNFAGQWLHLRNVSKWQPDPEKYPQFDESLRSALQQESELFFANIIRQDRSVLEFLDADYTFLNDRLARHYGLPGVRGSYFRKVTLNNPERGGILTQGAVLMVTSYPTRTSPVLRGKWVLENVIGSPPPPPPPNVPDLEDSASTSPKNLRAALEKHRSKAMCASCHSRLDPLGFALENYDGTGRYRKSEGGAEIDASGALPNGAKVSGPGDLKKILMDRRDEFVDCLAEKLLTYALGRGLTHQDLPAVRQIRREAAAKDFRFSELALAIVNSVPFQMRRTPEP